MPSTQTIVKPYKKRSEITLGLKTIVQIFLANNELELSILESADDITAAETAPNPITDTAGGVKYWRTNGNINL